MTVPETVLIPTLQARCFPCRFGRVATVTRAGQGGGGAVPCKKVSEDTAGETNREKCNATVGSDDRMSTDRLQDVERAIAMNE